MSPNWRILEIPAQISQKAEGTERDAFQTTQGIEEKDGRLRQKEFKLDPLKSS